MTIGGVTAGEPRQGLKLAPDSEWGNMSTVLLVDDERSIRMTFTVSLKEDGHTVIAASSAEEAWQRLQDADIDVMVSDIMMPGMHGVALLEMLAESGCDVEVILVTGYPTAETAIRAIRAGAFDYLPKPVFSSHLRKTVAAAGASRSKRMTIQRTADAERAECQRLAKSIATSLDGALCDLESKSMALMNPAEDGLLALLQDARKSADRLSEVVGHVEEFAASGAAVEASPGAAQTESSPRILRCAPQAAVQDVSRVTR